MMLISEGKERVVGNPGSGHRFQRDIFDKRHSHVNAEGRTLLEETWERCMKSSPGGGAQVGGGDRTRGRVPLDPSAWEGAREVSEAGAPAVLRSGH